jgi:hypothetical protein
MDGTNPDWSGRRQGMSIDSLHGVQIRGPDPKFLLLSDGSALVLDPEGCGGHGADWRLIAADGRIQRDRICAAEALRLAGENFATYIAVRTRAEVEWLRAVADWCREEAEALDRDFGEATELGKGIPLQELGAGSEHNPVSDDVRAHHLLVGKVPQVAATAGAGAGAR